MHIEKVLQRGFYSLSRIHEGYPETDRRHHSEKRSRRGRQGTRDEPVQKNPDSRTHLCRHRHLLLYDEVAQPTDQCYHSDNRILIIHAQPLILQKNTDKTQKIIIYRLNTLSFHREAKYEPKRNKPDN